MNRVHIIPGYIHQDICETMIVSAREQAAELKLEMGDRPEGIVECGVQEQGKTKRGEIIAHQAMSKLPELQLEEHRMPMAVAIIGPGATLEHAREKADRTARMVVRAVHHMIRLKNDLETKPQ